MRTLALLSLAIVVMLLPISGSEAHAQSGGGVVGTVIVSAPPQDPPPPLSPYARRRARPPQEPGVAQGTTDAFVYVESLSDVVAPASDTAARIVQRDRMILPYSTAVRPGQIVEFPNDDDVFHNLFSLSSGNRFSLGRYAPGLSPTHAFEESGVVRLFCDIHAEMAGIVLVLDTPWVVRVSDDGTYRLSGIPAGEYRAVAWHPTAGADTMRITVSAGRDVEARFSLASRR